MSYTSPIIDRGLLMIVLRDHLKRVTFKVHRRVAIERDDTERRIERVKRDSSR